MLRERGSGAGVAPQRVREGRGLYTPLKLGLTGEGYDRGQLCAREWDPEGAAS